PSDYNLWGVGICRNNTQICPEQEIIFIQEMSAQDLNKSFVFSGSRRFYQRLYIFASEATALKLNKRIFAWLTKFSLNKVPTFKALNQPNGSGDSWSWFFPQSDFSLTDQQTERAKPEKIIADVWQKISTNERNLWLQALDAIMSGKKLLIAIADNKDAKSKFLPKLDNLLLLFIPMVWRSKLSIAMGKDIDLEVCKWANIVVSFQEEKPSYWTDDWVCLDLASTIITPNQSITTSKYVKDFIEPLKDDFGSLITLCKKFAENENVGLNLKTTNNQKNSSGFGPDSSNVSRLLQGKPLDFSHPSVDFIANYPKDDTYKTQLFSKYFLPIKSELKIFLENVGKDQKTVLIILWEAIKQNLTTDADIAVLCLGKMFALLTKDEFFNPLWELEAADVMKLISHGLWKEIQKNVNKEDSLEFINKELQLISLKLIKEERKRYKYEQFKKFVSIHLQEIFFSDVEKFQLWDSFLAQEMSRENFLDLFNEQLIPLMPKIDLETFENSYLIKYLQCSFPTAHLGLQDVLSNRNLSKLCLVSSNLEMNNATTNKLYLNFLESQSPTYEISQDLLIDTIDRSIDPKTTVLKIQDLSDVYQWFNKKKPGLFDNLSKLHSTNQSWSDWEELASFLYPDDHNQENRVYFLDKIVAQKFTAEVLKTWFNLLKSEPNNPKIKESFLNGKTWKNLRDETIKNMYCYLTTEVPDYVSKLIQWASEKSRFDLINGKLTESAIEIWENNNTIDQQTWQILMFSPVQANLSNEKHFRMRIADLLCEPNSLSLTNNVEIKSQNISKERQNKSAIQENVSSTDDPLTNSTSTQMSNNNQNEGKVNESRRDLPLYNKEQKTLHLLTKLAREKINKFKDDPEKIEGFLELCETFEIKILEVLVEVDLKNCPGVFFKYLHSKNYDRNSTEYIRCFEKMLSQIQSNTKERDKIIDFVRDIGKNMIGEGDKELRELAVDSLAYWARQGLK
ncbi:hypothetical protein VV11_003415, partial [Trichodesmium erythraeum 21-75]|nr:hypothetical protein [Trichodesmium erythraeum 21-75]